MKQNFTFKNLFLIAASLGFGHVFGQVTTFSYTGASETYVVPAGVTSIQIETWGAQGGGSEVCGGSIDDDGGFGGYAIGNLDVTPGQVLNVYVGGKPSTTISGASPGGFNGGGVAGQYGGGGGGASDVRVGGTDLADRIIVAGGGGGGNTGCPDHGTGGAGGGLTGGDGISLAGYAIATGGSAMAGGIGAGGGTNGELGIGGTGEYHVAGGGGGYYGGGAAYAAGSGGGSSYLGGVLSGSTISGIRAGNGEIIITVLCEPLTVSVSSTTVCFGDTFTLDASGAGTITWDGGVINGEPFTTTMAGVTTYTATSDNPADCSYSVDILVYDEIEITYVTVDEIDGVDGSIDATVVGGTAPYLYDWDNDMTGDFDDTEDLTSLTGGTYILVVKDSLGCLGAQTVELGSQVSIRENDVLILSVYPNPSATFMTIAYPGNFFYELLNADGKLIFNGSATNSALVNVESLAAGTYFIRIRSNDKQELVKIVKN